MDNLLSRRLISVIFDITRPATIKTNCDLGTQMKLFNDRKQFKKALELFDKQDIKNIQTFSRMTITQALKACAQTGDLHRGSTIHRLIPSDLKNDFYISAILIHLHMQCGNVKDAESLFETSTKQTLGMYGAMMKGYIKNKMEKKAIDLYNHIKNPDEVIVTILFNACAQLRNNDVLSLIKKTTKQIPKYYLKDQFLLASLFNALIKCGDCSSAHDVLSKMIKPVNSYGNLMNGFNKENSFEKTLNLFYQMKIDNVEPNDIIYLCIIKALSQIADYSICQSIVQQIPNSFLADHRIETALIDMWGKIGYIKEAEQIFENVSQLDEIGYTTMINAYGLNGMGVQAIKLYSQVPSELIVESTQVCVLNACSHSGLIQEARSIFQNIPIKTERIYTTMVDCCSRASSFEEAQQLINEFECHHSPVWPMYMALLSGARNEKNADLAKSLHARMKKVFSGLIDPLTVASILLANVYASSGEIKKASDIRIELNKSGARKTVGLSWTVVNGQVYKFRAHEQSHPRSKEIYAELEKISAELIEHGYQYDSSWITRPLNQDETIASVLCGHSGRLAVAWNFVENPNTSLIQIKENLRVCGDCHQATKLIAAIRQCEIIVRDANRIHHFYKNGQCSCNDYF